MPREDGTYGVCIRENGSAYATKVWDGHADGPKAAAMLAYKYGTPTEYAEEPPQDEPESEPEPVRIANVVTVDERTTLTELTNSEWRVVRNVDKGTKYSVTYPSELQARLTLMRDQVRWEVQPWTSPNASSMPDVPACRWWQSTRRTPGDRVFCVATANRLNTIPGELKRRFKAGEVEVRKADAADSATKADQSQLGVTKRIFTNGHYGEACRIDRDFQAWLDRVALDSPLKRGTHLIPVTLLDDVYARLDEAQAKYETEADALAPEYDRAKLVARLRLKELYHDGDYPDHPA
jgi:hypothetical protein